MSGSTVYILTTEGPVEIQRIVEEDPAVNSVICLDGLTQILPISPAYEAFVRRPAGVIERMTGHGAYRMDVSARIDEGRSWQLAAYLAHATRMQGDGGAVIFASGEVDSNLAVRPVEHVDLKLRALAQFVGDNDIDVSHAVILVPDTTSDIPDQIGGVPLHKTGSIAEALSLAGLKAMTAPSVAVKPDASSPTVAHRRTQPLAILIGAALIAAVLFWVGGDFARWSALMEQGRVLELEQDMMQAEESTFGGMRAEGFRKWLIFSRPDSAPLDIEGAVLVADDVVACADTTARQKHPLTKVFQGNGAVCMVEIRSIGSDDTIQIGRLGYWPVGLGNGERPARIMRGSRDTSGRTWTLEFDDLPESGAMLRLVVIAGAVDINGPQPWYQNLLAAPVGSAAFDAAKHRLVRLGFEVTVLDWRRE